MQIYTCPEMSTNRSTIRGKLLNIDLCPVFISWKVGEDLRHKEIKPVLINEQSVVCKLNFFNVAGVMPATVCWLHASASLTTNRWA